ncbi:MAG: hypothetical protein ABFC18_03130 [Rikenellaceae bacterium]
MKELRSRKFPQHKPQIVTDEEYEKIISLGLSSRFVMTDIKPLKPIIPSLRVEPEIQIKTKKK